MWNRLESELRKLCYRIRFGSRFRAHPSSIILRPSLIQLERGASLELGPGAVIERGCRVVVRERLVLNEDAYVGAGCTLIAYARLTVGRRALLGERVSIHTEDHGPYWNRNMFCVADVTVGDDVWICAGTVVAKGSDIGARTTVGANSFVNSRIPPDVLAVGCPARPTRPLAQPTEKEKP